MTEPSSGWSRWPCAWIEARQGSPEAGGLIDETMAELLIAIGKSGPGARPPSDDPVRRRACGGRGGVGGAVGDPITANVTEARFRTEIEVAAYYVIAEGLTNVARYANATEAHVEVMAVDGRLHVMVADDGQGGADPSMGSGLRGLADRLAAIGGDLEVTSAAGAGTTLTATLPMVVPP